MASALTLKLPFPPSANRLWRNVRGRTIRSPEYDAWLEQAAWEVRRIVSMQHDRKGVKGPYGLTIRVCPPPGRRGPRMDIDNTLKSVCDALQKGGAVENDRLCQCLSIEWCPDVSGVVATVLETTLRLPAAQKRRKAA